MTHNCLTYEYDCRGLLSHVYTNIWKVSPYYMYHSFGGLRLSRSTKSTLTLEMDIVNEFGDRVLTHTIDYQSDSNLA